MVSSRLLLLCCILYQCYTRAADVHVYITKEQPSEMSPKPFRYRLSTTDNPWYPWEAINKLNALPGGVSYFRARDRAGSPEDQRQDREEASGNIEDFSKKMYVCSWESDSLVQENPCKEGREAFVFYVSDKQLRDTSKLYYGICETTTSGGTGKKFYSRVSTLSNVCGDHVTNSSGFFHVYDPRLGCGPPEAPENAYIIEKRSYPGTENLPYLVRYSCNAGYRMEGTSYMQCTRYGEWIENPRCIRIECESPPTIDNGRIQLDSSKPHQLAGKYFSGDYVNYQCDEGYELYPKSGWIQCQGNGEWSDAGAHCNKKSCGYPGTLDNGDMIGNSYNYHDRVVFYCDPGYKLVGESSAECLATGRWDKELPICIQIRCPQLPYPYNGYYTQPGLGVGSEVVYQCDDGYTMKGAPVLKCTQQGTTGGWDQPPPTCDKIMCPSPDVHADGSFIGLDFSYGHEIQFTCNEGFLLNGPDTARCGANGWNVAPPSCEVITCNPPKEPEHGSILSNQTIFVYKDHLNFDCETGYKMQGVSVLRCEADGTWSSEAPSCKPVLCPPMNAPHNGAKEGDKAEFSAVVTFSCFPGYQLIGSVSTMCQEDSTWSNQKPKCQVCPVGTYKESRDNIPCVKCPALSTTATEGSTSLLQCVCGEGARQTEDGQCQAIECSPLEAPAHGSMSECGSEGGTECRFSCEAGHMLRGSSVRRCTAAGWTGQPAQCLECPANTYQVSSSSSSCLPCPHHTVTTKSASAITDCACEPGYVGPAGGPCEDVDECAEDNGGCDQACTNMDGDHICSCSIPGYDLENDGKSCYLNQTCPSLDTNPSNGFLECKKTPEYNAVICYIKCNPGYFFVSGINNYVTCGPDTDFGYSHQRVNKTARIADCTRQFFVDILLPLCFDYMSSASCEDLVAISNEAKSQIKKVVEGLDVCQHLCQLLNFNYSCRANPDATPGGSKQTIISVCFDVLVVNMDENAVSPNCDGACQRKNLRQMLGMTLALKTAVERLVKERSDLLKLTSTELVSSSFSFTNPHILCEEGHVLTKARLCVPCDAGYYLPSRELDTCLPCPVGTYQDKQGQTSCKPCPEGATTLDKASDHPFACNTKAIEKKPGIVTPKLEVGIDKLQEEEVEEVLSVLR